MIPARNLVLGLFLALGCAAPAAPPAPAPGVPPSPATSAPERLRRDVTGLTDLGPRNTSHPQALEQAAAYVSQRFAAIGLPATRQEFDAAGVRVANLEATLPGPRAALVVVGAHYDSVGSSPGADDNASGVALLLELASRFTTRPAGTELRFVAFTNEEPPHFMGPTMGSLVYARALRKQGAQVAAMLSLECLGFYADEPGSQRVPPGLQGVFRERGDFVALVSDEASGPRLDRAADAFARATDLPLLALPLPPQVQEGSWSDHWSFQQVGYPGMMATDTALFRNPHYHRDSDRPDTLDYARMAQAADGLEAAVRALADGGPAAGPSNAPRSP